MKIEPYNFTLRISTVFSFTDDRSKRIRWIFFFYSLWVFGHQTTDWQDVASSPSIIITALKPAWKMKKPFCLSMFIYPWTDDTCCISKMNLSMGNGSIAVNYSEKRFQRRKWKGIVKRFSLSLFIRNSFSDEWNE